MSSQNLCCPKNYNREDGMGHICSCPMLQIGVKGENGNGIIMPSLIYTRALFFKGPINRETKTTLTNQSIMKIAFILLSSVITLPP